MAFIPFPNFATSAIHTGKDLDIDGYGSVVPSISVSATFRQSSPKELIKGFEYGRYGNPSRDGLEETLAVLDNGKYAVSFGSGLAAVSQISHLLKTGDGVICSNDTYGGTSRFFREIANTNGLSVSFVDCTDIGKIKAALAGNIRLVWLETPSNPTMRVTDIKAVSDLVHNYNKEIIVAVDNTFMSSYFQRPLELGADIAHHSLTKFMNGHCDVVMGCAVVRNENIYKRLRFLQQSVGAVPSAFDCFLVSRGLKTLHLRMREHMQNGLAVAAFLEGHPSVEKVNHPGLQSHPQYELMKRQCRGYSGVLSFTLKGGMADALLFLKALKIFTLAVSLGCCESLATHAATMTHEDVPLAERLAVGVTDSLIRLSVGLENVEDLIADLDQALRFAVSR